MIKKKERGKKKAGRSPFSEASEWRRKASAPPTAVVETLAGGNKGGVLEDGGADTERSGLMTGTADSFRESSER